MSQGLTRRGFARAAGVGLATACVPSWAGWSGRALASAPAVLIPRWQLAPGALELTLFVRTASGAPVELLAYAVDVVGELRAGDRPHALTFTSVGREAQRRSRAGRRLSRHMVVAADSEAIYDTFVAPWPENAARTGTLVLETTLRPELMRASPEERDSLGALGGLTLELPVTSPV